LKSLPLAVQQKQIIVTCNYEARRRGLYKLQLIREAKKACPDVIIVLGEDLTRFRNASKELYNFLKSFVWNQKAERLGFDEVFLDVTDIVDYNLRLLNHNSLPDSFFHLDQHDPTVGFEFDATRYAGCTFPAGSCANLPDQAKVPKNLIESVSVDLLELRLRLGSHLAQYLRHQLEYQKGYTSTVGISTNKLLSKLVGNVNKPTNQTTLKPPYACGLDNERSNVVMFMDPHDIGKVPGIGFKLSHKIRSHILGREAKFQEELVYGGTKENVTVEHARSFPGMGPRMLDEVLRGPGSYKGIGERIWALLHGVDDTEVGKARDIPKQISIEDSYLRLNIMTDVQRELRMLATSLIRRMRIDLTEADEDEDSFRHGAESDSAPPKCSRRWRAHPQVLRLSTRPRPPPQPDGTRVRAFQRISRSGPMPTFIFSHDIELEQLAEKLVNDALIPLFRKLHPETSAWDLSLVNIAATDIREAAGDDKDAGGRDISKMFKKQDMVLRQWKVDDINMAPAQVNSVDRFHADQGIGIETNTSDAFQLHQHEKGSEDNLPLTQVTIDSDDSWNSEDGDDTAAGSICKVCGAVMPVFALSAHERFHMIPD
jgi:DNA polymerase iota